MQPVEPGCERFTDVALTVAPLFELVPRTLTHWSALIALRPTLSIWRSWVEPESDQEELRGPWLSAGRH